jgi:MtfA peptidase
MLAAIFYFVYNRRKNDASAPIEVPNKWKLFLNEKVVFYKNLNLEQQDIFEQDIRQFLNAVRITGVQTEIRIEDRLLVAASAVIPLFGFP